jgi:glycosyltransferase involved in cell wall biosynthesis
VLHVLGTGRRSGTAIGKIVEGLMRTAPRDRYSFSVLFLESAGSIGRRFKSMDIPTFAAAWSASLRDLAGAARFAGEIRKSSPQIVHFHAGGRAPRAIARMASGAKIIAHFHSSGVESGYGGRAQSTRGADAVLANSAATASSLGDANATVVYPGVVAPPRIRRQPHASGTMTIGAAGRLTPVKGIEFLLEAVSLLSRDGSAIKLDIVGEGAELPRLTRLSEELGLSENVRFCGWMEDFTALADRWDVFVQPSLSEGFGLSILEAMAAGLPVVATMVGGIPEIVIDGATGILVPPANAEALAESISALAGDPARRATMGDNGRIRAQEDFSLEESTRSICLEYDRLLG